MEQSKTPTLTFLEDRNRKNVEDLDGNGKICSINQISFQIRGYLIIIYFYLEKFFHNLISNLMHFDYAFTKYVFIDVCNH